MNYTLTLKMEAVKARDMSEHLCQNNRSSCPRTENSSEKGRETHLQLKNLFLRMFKFFQMR